MNTLHSTTQQARPERRSTGFTLIELLVVIAIIAILAAILFPVFARARENARRASCQSNVKQIGLGILQYVQDYDEKFPFSRAGQLDTPGTMVTRSGAGLPSGQFSLGGDDKDSSVITPTAANGYTGAITYMDAIFPYVKSLQIFSCPSHTNGDDSPSYGINTCVSGWYRFNCGGGGGGGLGSQGQPASLSEIARSSEVIMIMDSPFRAVQTWGAGYAQIFNNVPSFFPHFAGSNYCFTDGHVKWLNKSKMYTTEYSGEGSKGWSPFVGN